MKINDELLSSQKAETPEPPESLPPLKAPPDPALPYKKDEFKLDASDPLYLYDKMARPYAEKQGYRVVTTIKQALELRAEGKLALSMREADVAARKRVDLTSRLIQHALRDGVLEEDIAGYSDSVYELRSFYNRGLQWIMANVGKIPEESERMMKARGAMRETIDRLKVIGLPAWPEEEKRGFPLEFCRPEFMTFDQYALLMTKPKRRETNNDQAHDTTASAEPVSQQNPHAEAVGVSHG